MRKTTIGLLFALGALMVTPAQAFDSDWRVKGGLLSIENDESAAFNAGIIYAMDFAGMIGAELEANTSITDGEIFPDVDYGATQLGGYGTLTTPGPIYFKAKAGYVYTDISGDSYTNGPLTIEVGGSESGVSYGIGAGFFGFELEYTRTSYDEGDIDFLSLAYGF